MNFTFFGSVFWHAIMPVLTLSPYLIGEFQTTMRSSMISVLGEDYVTMGRAKGLGDGRDVLLCGAQRHAAGADQSSADARRGVRRLDRHRDRLQLSGLGLTLFTASVARDYPVIQGQLLLMTLATLGAISWSTSSTAWSTRASARRALSFG